MLAVLAVLALVYVGHAVFGRAAAPGSASVSRSTYRSTPRSSSQAAPSAPAPSAARTAAGGSAPAVPSKPRVALGVRFGHAALGWQGAYVITGASGLRVSLTTRQACWTRRWVDGSATYLDLTIPAGQTVHWSAAHSLRVELGNAPGIATVVVDGQTGPALPRQGVNPEWLDFRLG